MSLNTPFNDDQDFWKSLGLTSELDLWTGTEFTVPELDPQGDFCICPELDLEDSGQGSNTKQGHDTTEQGSDTTDIFFRSRTRAIRNSFPKHASSYSEHGSNSPTPDNDVGI
jgi:hypothetical protein